jgi:hypothetical protein
MMRQKLKLKYQDLIYNDNDKIFRHTKQRFSPGTQTYDYSPDSYDEKFKEVGGKGFFGDIKN